MNKDKSVLWEAVQGRVSPWQKHDCITACICQFGKTEAKWGNLCCAASARVELHCPASPSLGSSREPSFPHLRIWMSIRSGHLPDMELLRDDLRKAAGPAGPPEPILLQFSKPSARLCAEVQQLQDSVVVAPPPPPPRPSSPSSQTVVCLCFPHILTFQDSSSACHSGTSGLVSDTQ